MSAAELAEWQVYAEIEPFGSHFDDLRAGSIVAATYNVNRDPQRRPDAWNPLDFMPWNDLSSARQAEPEAPADPEAHARLIDARLFGRR